ncbi:hypothetical protein AVEN_16769-1 [Araneus ventricosus]|uniref:DDE-1 domain-containing protein n=1 Tax=Araneus ventricosus TaxID=182803 RepID=A0A4Y2BQA4_ARAVE|nr:hypothetical protein AVEN_16769-1 [Araneus ventricosus]
MDETGISTVPNRTTNVITPKGKKSACKIPATSILSRKRMNPLLYKDAPNGHLPLISDTSYMNSHFFFVWLKHFVKHAKPSAEDPVLLIADNDTSRCSLPAVFFFVERIM